VCRWTDVLVNVLFIPTTSKCFALLDCVPHSHTHVVEDVDTLACWGDTHTAYGIVALILLGAILPYRLRAELATNEVHAHSKYIKSPM